MDNKKDEGMLSPTFRLRSVLHRKQEQEPKAMCALGFLLFLRVNVKNGVNRPFYILLQKNAFDSSALCF